MSRYVVYGFRTMDMEEDGVYVTSSDDRDYAIEIGGECGYSFFGVLDTKTDEWLPV
jgi:hypothetical protein